MLDNKKLNGADQHTEAIQFSTVFVQILTIENRNKGQYVLYKTEERGRPDIKDTYQTSILILGMCLVRTQDIFVFGGSRIATKGQKISKANYGFLNYPKK